MKDSIFEKGRVTYTPFFLVMKYIILLIFFLNTACTAKKDIFIMKEFIQSKDLLILQIQGVCDRKKIITKYDKSIEVKDYESTGLFLVDRNKEGKNLSNIEAYCNNKEIARIELPETNFRITFALLFNELSPDDVLEEEKLLFKQENFYLEFKRLVNEDTNFLINALKIIDYFPLERQVEILYESYKKLKNPIIYEYILNNFEKFISLPDFERFIILTFESGNKENLYRLLDKLFIYPTRRVFYIIHPYIVKDREIREKVFKFLHDNQKGEFYTAFLESLEAGINRDEKDEYVINALNLVLKNFDIEVRFKFLKKALSKNSYLNVAQEALLEIPFDRNLANFLLNNFESLDKSFREKIFKKIEPFYKEDLLFYLKMLENLPEKKEEILNNIAYDFLDERLDKYYIEYASRRPIPEFVLNYLQKLPEVKKQGMLKLIFSEPVVQKEVIDLIYENDKELFRKLCKKILEDDNHVLNEYIVEKIGDTKVLPVSSLIENFHKSKYKEKILIALAKMGEEGNNFVYEFLKKNIKYSNQVLTVFFERAEDEKIMEIWKKLDKKDKGFLISALNGIENRRRPVLCDDIIEITLKNNDREIKFSALWAYVYSCQELFLKDFDRIRSSGDKDLYFEMIDGLRDLSKIRQDLIKEVRFKIENLIDKENDIAIRDKLISVIKDF